LTAFTEASKGMYYTSYPKNKGEGEEIDPSRTSRPL